MRGVAESRRAGGDEESWGRQPQHPIATPGHGRWPTRGWGRWCIKEADSQTGSKTGRGAVVALSCPDPTWASVARQAVPRAPLPPSPARAPRSQSTDGCFKALRQHGPVPTPATRYGLTVAGHSCASNMAAGCAALSAPAGAFLPACLAAPTSPPKRGSSTQDTSHVPETPSAPLIGRHTFSLGPFCARLSRWRQCVHRSRPPYPAPRARCFSCITVGTVPTPPRLARFKSPSSDAASPSRSPAPAAE